METVPMASSMGRQRDLIGAQTSAGYFGSRQFRGMRITGLLCAAQGSRTKENLSVTGWVLVRGQSPKPGQSIWARICQDGPAEAVCTPGKRTCILAVRSHSVFLIKDNGGKQT